MQKPLHDAARLLLDAFYPRSCFSCDSILAPNTPRSGLEAWLCPTCLDTVLKVEPPYCEVCGEPYDGALVQPFRCWNCLGRKLAFDFALSAHKAEGAVRDMIHAFKYHRQLSMRAPLAELMLPIFSDPRLASQDLREWLLVPVPLHPFRRIWRGYNQSLELCRKLGRLKGIKTVQLLRRSRVTRAQAGLARGERLRNLKGIFAPRWLAPDVKGRKVLLVDDVLTTGATTHECAKVLKMQAGVEKVVVITAARV